jgi:hypothetical protein
MIDPDLKYCPECNDEYRAEIEKCAACGIDLITGLQKIEMEEARQKKLESRTAELSPDDDLVGLRRGPLPEMRHIAALLDVENIGTLLLGDMNTCVKKCCPSVYNLMVKSEDGMEALQIIEEEHKRTTGLAHHENVNGDSIFNPHASEAQCPACGNAFPTTQTTCPDCGLNFG